MRVRTTRGVTAWYRLTRDHRGSMAQRILGLVGRVFQLQRCVKMSDISSHLELWESHIREYEKLVFQTEKIQTKVPDSCKVFIVRSFVPKDLEKDMLKISPTANYMMTKEYILEQASLERDAHFDDKGKHDKLVLMEVDALLAKVTALKEGTFMMVVEDDRNTKKRKLERVDGAARKQRRKRRQKRGKGKGFQGYCNFCGKLWSSFE